MIFVISLFILSILGLLFWRVAISDKIPKAIDTLTPNANLTEAYEANDGKLTLQYQDLVNISYSPERYGYFAEFTHSKFFEGESGMEHMNALMDSLRKSAPTEIAGRRVLYTDDISSLVRTYADGRTEKLDYSPSNVLRFELEGGDWAAMRPSGTEPKLKIYGGAHGTNKSDADLSAEAIRTALAQFL